MGELVLYGFRDITLCVDRGCLVVRVRQISEQTRIIPIMNVLCVEVAKPQENHRGYIYFRTPVANKSIKASVGGRDISLDDDMVFFDSEENYQAAVKIQEYILNYHGNH